MQLCWQSLWLSSKLPFFVINNDWVVFSQRVVFVFCNKKKYQNRISGSLQQRQTRSNCCYNCDNKYIQKLNHTIHFFFFLSFSGPELWWPVVMPLNRNIFSIIRITIYGSAKRSALGLGSKVTVCVCVCGCSTSCFCVGVCTRQCSVGRYFPLLHSSRLAASFEGDVSNQPQSGLFK